MNRFHALIFGVILISTPLRAETVVDVEAPACRPGAHNQPNGPFALYVFCDDALGTNVAVFLQTLGAPAFGKYKLSKRFWQGESWANDVTSYAWLKDAKHLLVATSGLNGTGAVYLLNLETQQFQTKQPDLPSACIFSVRDIEGKRIVVGITDCEHAKEYKIEFVL